VVIAIGLDLYPRRIVRRILIARRIVRRILIEKGINIIISRQRIMWIE
jgi:hypothetical protein